MMKNFEDIQKVNQKSLDASVRSMNEVNKGIQAIAAELTDYTKRSFEDGSHVMEQLMGIRSVEQAMELQTGLMQKSYSDAISQATKLSNIYADMSRDAYKPLEKALAKGK